MASEPQHNEPLRHAQPDIAETAAEPATPPEAAAALTLQPDQADLRRDQGEPTQPTAPDGEALTWTSEGGMVQQQTSAMEWLKASEAERRADVDNTHDETVPADASLGAVESTATQNPRESGAVSQESEASVSSRKDEPPIVESATEGETQFTEAQAARAEHLASLVEAEETSLGATLQPAHSPEQ